MQRAKRYDNSFGLVMFDIDNFKDINDVYGHDAGDTILIELSDLISSLIRGSDLFGRWGGEEYLILLPNISQDQLSDFTEKIRNAVEKHIFKNISQITISVGATSFNRADTKKLLLKRVDKALYQAKNEGRNLVVFN